MWNFVKDLAIWQEAEKVFARYLIDYPKLISLEFSQWKFKDYDIKMTYGDNKVATYEIKRDMQAQDTGNVALEIRYKWDASWIYTSKADYIVYYAAGKWFLQRRWELILRLEKANKKIVKWWDWWQSELMLVKLEDMNKIFEQINLDYVYDCLWQEQNISKNEKDSECSQQPEITKE